MRSDAAVVERLNVGSHDGEETRRRILAVALELIADQGFAATSTRAIAERLRFTKAALYYHFRTKDDLLAALIAPIKQSIDELVQGASGSSAVERRQIVGRYVDLVATYEEPIRVLSQPSVAVRPAAQAVQPLYERLTRILSDQDDPDVIARARVRAALGAIHAVFSYAEPDDDRSQLCQTAFESACDVLGLGLRNSVAQ